MSRPPVSILACVFISLLSADVRADENLRELVRGANLQSREQIRAILLRMEFSSDSAMSQILLNGTDLKKGTLATCTVQWAQTEEEIRFSNTGYVPEAATTWYWKAGQLKFLGNVRPNSATGSVKPATREAVLAHGDSPWVSGLFISPVGSRRYFDAVLSDHTAVKSVERITENGRTLIKASLAEANRDYDVFFDPSHNYMATKFSMANDSQEREIIEWQEPVRGFFFPAKAVVRVHFQGMPAGMKCATTVTFRDVALNPQVIKEDLSLKFPPNSMVADHNQSKIYRTDSEERPTGPTFSIPQTIPYEKQLATYETRSKVYKWLFLSAVAIGVAAIARMVVIRRYRAQ